MDIKTLFSNGKIGGNFFMKLSEDIKCEEVCKLNKSLCRLKQAAKCWFGKSEYTLKLKDF